MRGGEVCALSIEDINFSRKTITVSKTVSRNKHKEAYINANHPFQAVDCIFFCFVLLLCITVLRNPAAPAVEEPAAEE